MRLMRVVIHKRKHILRNSIMAMLAIVGLLCGLRALTPMVFPQLDYISSLSQTAVEPIWPDYGSGAVGVVGSDNILTQHGNQSARPIASITKAITALVVLSSHPLNDDEEGPNIVFTEADVEIYNKAVMADAAVEPVKVGDYVSERQAIEIMMLPSACNYAETLAIWAYGSTSSYLTAANRWLSKNGLSQTKVVDASGLAPGNVSTPSDLIKLGSLVLGSPSLASIVATKQTSLKIVGDLINGNRLLGELGVNGIKTGFTDEAGACLLFSSVIEVGDEKEVIVGVLLGGKTSAEVATDVAALLNSVIDGFRSVKLISKGQKFGSYSTYWGQKASLVASQDFTTAVWSDTPISVRVNSDGLLTLRDGEEAGTVEVNIGGKIYSQTLLVAF